MANHHLRYSTVDSHVYTTSLDSPSFYLHRFGAACFAGHRSPLSPCGQVTSSIFLSVLLLCNLIDFKSSPCPNLFSTVTATARLFAEGRNYPPFHHHRNRSASRAGKAKISQHFIFFLLWVGCVFPDVVLRLVFIFSPQANCRSRRPPSVSCAFLNLFVGSCFFFLFHREE